MADVEAAGVGLGREGQDLEWKPSWRDEYLKWHCGFANAQGDRPEIGTDDRDEVVGVKDALRLMKGIPNKVQSLPGIVVDVGFESESGREYPEILVAPYPNPISYRGKYRYRSSSTKHVVGGAALNRFVLGKHGPNWDDAPLLGVGLVDLGRMTLDDSQQRGIASDRLPPDAGRSVADGLFRASAREERRESTEGK
ncbi:MAG: hypothetical protein OXI83_06545 [Gemmatimonadota bacterium]|nr:hypothetical protein [Gemmatimonadota bacterium]